MDNSPTSLPLLVDRILSGYRLGSVEEVLQIIDQTPRKVLYDECHRLTRILRGDGFDTCTIINVKSGKCPEDCKWCAQSAKYNTGCDTYDVLSPIKCVDQARQNAASGIKRFSLVASGRGPTSRDLVRYTEIFREIKQSVPIDCCASLGLASFEALEGLRTAGVTTYHCNMETAPSFFPSLCSTHTQADKEQTIASARRAGLRVCSGGIIGMGESRLQRIEFALYLSSLGVESIPMNVLQPISGTPLGQCAPLSEDEILESVAIFRLVNPTAYIRFSGGRSLLSSEVQRKALYIGVNAAIMGDLLTTIGSNVKQDMELFEEMKYNAKLPTTWKR